MKQLQGNPQKEISRNVERRGYYESYEPEPLLARHVAKMQEELGELAVSFWMGGELPSMIADAAIEAEEVFDNKGGWADERIGFDRDYGNPDTVKSELADVLVVVMSMAELINRHYGPYDVIQAALEKSRNDVERGVR